MGRSGVHLQRYILRIYLQDNPGLESVCGAVGRAVASDTRDPWFESSHQQIDCIEILSKRRK